ncbi:MAG: hypothetical protein ACE5MK_08810, partial [Acidobacteriota bacterium]
NVEADLSTEPDGLFVSFEAIQSGRVRLVEGAGEGYIELEGSPEMVLEVGDIAQAVRQVRENAT